MVGFVPERWVMRHGPEARATFILNPAAPPWHARPARVPRNSPESGLLGEVRSFTVRGVPINFQPLDREKPVHIYRRNLPHWRQEGATYFVTFRTHDSLSSHILAYLEQLRHTLLKLSTKGLDAGEADRAYFSKMEKHLDEGHGACPLGRPPARDVVDAALRHFDGQRYQLGSCVIMPNHIHVLVKPLERFELEGILQSWKSYTAKAANAHLGRQGRFWQDEYYDRLVRDSAELHRIERYISRHPRR